MNTPELRIRLKEILVNELGEIRGDVAFKTVEIAWHRHGFDLSDLLPSWSHEAMVLAALAAGLLEAERLTRIKSVESASDRRHLAEKDIALRLVHGGKR